MGNEGFSPWEACPKRQKARFAPRSEGGSWCGTHASPEGSPKGQDAGNRRLRKQARVRVRPQGRPGPSGQGQGGDHHRLRSRRRRCPWGLTPGGLSGGVQARPLAMPGEAQGAALQSPSTGSEFAGHRPANVHARSAQTGIVRVGRRGQPCGPRCSPWPRALSRSRPATATRKTRRDDAAHPGATLQGSVPELS